MAAMMCSGVRVACVVALRAVRCGALRCVALRVASRSCCVVC